MGDIFDEVVESTPWALRAYLAGASRDGCFSNKHKTFRYAQKDPDWLDILDLVLRRLGHGSWRYREGSRDVWVLETSYDPRIVKIKTDFEEAAFACGYFDAEGGIPQNTIDRMYIQFVQKNHEDLMLVRESLMALEVGCGTIHNPSKRVDPNYWRFYVNTDSQQGFWHAIGSWHHRKRCLLQTRFGPRVLPDRLVPLIKLKEEASLPGRSLIPVGDGWRLADPEEEPDMLWP